MTIIPTDFPGSDTAEALRTLSVTDRYLIVRLTILGTPVYIHNVYAPVDPTERKPFSTNFPPDLLNSMRLISFAEILKQPCAPVLIVLVVPLATSQVESPVWNGYPIWVFWMLGVCTTPMNVSLLDSAEEKPTGLYPSVGISLPFRLQGLQICGTPSHGGSPGPCSCLCQSVPASGPWLLEVSNFAIRLSSDQRGDRGGSGSHFGIASFFLSSRKGLGTLEKTHQEAPTTNPAKDTPSERSSPRPGPIGSGQSGIGVPDIEPLARQDDLRRSSSLLSRTCDELFQIQLRLHVRLPNAAHEAIVQALLPTS
uniref:AlNc14C98G5933 protein n=1 Tax=Albugo laibachii Nc14 TaxID=890382 RepID=F0WH58_9STRA|nr:AlNc14C98G5933 [Albugo laibachii Nc14]|eukprot:CCA20573.1 AlNc14C98G5933 [Albugo laibachii Nc14]